MHFLNNLVPLGLLVANNKQAKHLVRLASHHNCSDFLCLENVLELVKGGTAECLGFFRFVGRELEIRHHFLPDVMDHQPDRLDFCHHSFLLDDMKNSNDVDKIVLVSTARERSHGEVGAIRHLDPDLLAFLFLNQISQGDARDRRSRTRLPFLAFGGF